MQTVYRTIDGKIFEAREDALNHEFEISKSIIMLDWHSRPTQTTKDARVIWLANEKAAEMFLDMTKAQGDLDCVGIESDAVGLFAWDESQEQYIWINDDIAESIAKIVDIWTMVEEEELQ